jgi:hypothetical protein
VRTRGGRPARPRKGTRRARGDAGVSGSPYRPRGGQRCQAAGREGWRTPAGGVKAGQLFFRMRSVRSGGGGFDEAAGGAALPCRAGDGSVSETRGVAPPPWLTTGLDCGGVGLGHPTLPAERRGSSTVSSETTGLQVRIKKGRAVVCWVTWVFPSTKPCLEWISVMLCPACTSSAVAWNLSLELRSRLPRSNKSTGAGYSCGKTITSFTCPCLDRERVQKKTCASPSCGLQSTLQNRRYRSNVRHLIDFLPYTSSKFI